MTKNLESVSTGMPTGAALVIFEITRFIAPKTRNTCEQAEDVTIFNYYKSWCLSEPGPGILNPKCFRPSLLRFGEKSHHHFTKQLLIDICRVVVAFDDSQDNRVHRLGRLWGRLRYLVLELLRRRIARRREFRPRPVLLPHLSDYFELLFDRFIGRRRRRVLMLRHR